MLALAVHDNGNIARDQLRTFIERYYEAPLKDAQEMVGCRAVTVDEVVHASANLNLQV